MTRVAYKFRPYKGSSFHFGREGLDNETSAESFPSDSLFAALVSVMVEAWGAQAAEDLLNQWTAADQSTAPPFILSSLFPFAGDLPLFPMPRLHVNLSDSTLRAHTKFLKKVKYVSPDVLGQLLTGADMTAWLPGDAGSQGLALQKGKVWISRAEVGSLPKAMQGKPDAALENMAIWKVTTAPHVAVDRFSNSSSIYLVGRTVFAEGCGVWLLAEINSHRAELEALFDLLADRGLGGRRSSGHGAFEWAVMEKPPALPDANGSPRVMTLSRYSPTETEIAAGVLGEAAAYELVDVGGWLWSPEAAAQRRKRLRLIEAGSILGAAVPVRGQLVDVRPEYAQPGAPQHAVYRSGVALTIGVAAPLGGQHG